jgi:hypothetical protein
MTPPTIFAGGTCLPSLSLSNHRADPQTLLWWDTDRIENEASNNSIIARVFVAAGRCLPTSCLATTGNTHRDTQRDGRDLWSTPFRRNPERGKEIYWTRNLAYRSKHPSSNRIQISWCKVSNNIITFLLIRNGYYYYPYCHHPINTINYIIYSIMTCNK